jgi:hypothetical protein
MELADFYTQNEQLIDNIILSVVSVLVPIIGGIFAGL